MQNCNLIIVDLLCTHAHVHARLRFSIKLFNHAFVVIIYAAANLEAQNETFIRL